MSDPVPATRSSGAARFAGAALIATHVLAIGAMAHHPTAHGDTQAQVVDGFVQMQGLNTAVHAAMIAAVLASWLALAEFGARRGAQRALVRSAGLLYAAGTAGMVGAALTNGFIATRIAVAAQGGDARTVEAAGDLLRLCWAANQTLAGFGLYAISAAIALWSLDLLRDRRVLALAAGGYGVAIAAAGAGGHALGAYVLDVRGMAAVVLAHAVWYVLVGVLMWRGGAARAAPAA
ncbi:hypothetical protein [Cognatilysobacter tabacisoli]|uniref:hypothetical protein n=1 Tax=Cognatilysobacter tabacisoli TaxID=2315424 RepID=UPI000E6AF0E7|nr:hypothetical protein [Lysobacter tabacisoli]